MAGSRLRMRHFVLGLLSCAAMPAHAETIDPKSLLDLSLEELSNIEVTSVSKRAEKASEAAAAVYVVTQEDIRRSGATSIPEALRLAPGLNVARSGAHGWAISSRGFNDQFSNKLLVLMDGRTVYTPLFSGTFWDLQDTFMADIDRIEVIRGPGATLWGANAVNGVINIITKKAKDTQGNYVNALAGNQEGNLAYRHGGKTEKTNYRVYAQQNFHDETRLSNRDGAQDIFRKSQGGFRSETKLQEKDTLTVQGDAYKATEDALLMLPTTTSPFTFNMGDRYHFDGFNVLTRWTRELESQNEMSLQSYLSYDYADTFYYSDKQLTFDLDFQHSLDLTERQNITWGIGYRMVMDNFNGTFYDNITPNDKNFDLFSMFLQDKINLHDNKVFLTLGSKFEQNDFSGFELQPSARFSWLITPEQTFWTSVSRAVRTPSRSVDGLSLIAGANGSGFAKLGSNTAADSEELIAYEAGYRIRPTVTTSVDIATFYNVYDKLINGMNGSPMAESSFGVGPYGVVYQIPFNTGKGVVWGGEIAASWQVVSDWSLTTGYSLLHMNLEGSSLVTSETKSPQHQANLRSHWRITDALELDNTFYYVDRLLPSATTRIPAYLRADVRLAWRPIDGLELSAVGQNLLDDQHPEFSPFLYNAQAEIGRSAYINARWQF